MRLLKIDESDVKKEKETNKKDQTNPGSDENVVRGAKESVKYFKEDVIRIINRRRILMMMREGN